MTSLQKIRKKNFSEILESLDDNKSKFEHEDLDFNYENPFESEAVAYLNSLYLNRGDLL